MKAELWCWALTPQGAELARRIAADLGGRVCVPARLALPQECGFDRLAPAVAERWQGASGHVFVAAAGIVVRCIAPLVHHKSRDPGVVVCDQNGRFAVSLLSGHLGQANALARAVASCLHGEAVITTGTDSAGLPSFDMLAEQAGCAFADVNEVRTVSAALLEGGFVLVRDSLNVLDAAAITACQQCRLLNGERVSQDAERLAEGNEETYAAEVVVSLAPLSPRPGLLRLHPRRVYAGVGCRKGVPGAVIENAVRQALALAGISPFSLASLATAELKAEEPGLQEAARSFGVPVRCFASGELAAQDVPHPSVKAAEVLGVERVGVCEAAALLAGGPDAVLLVDKQVFDASGQRLGRNSGDSGMITIALARGSGCADRTNHTSVQSSPEDA